MFVSDYLRAAAFITPWRAECCTEELHWGLVVTPIWPAIDDWLLPEDPWAAELMTACREACCDPELTFGLLAAPT
jgi:hypothetical protein